VSELRSLVALFSGSGSSLPAIWRGLRLAVAPPERPPFAIDALVVEDDTWHVLGSDPGFRPTHEHPIRLMRELAAAEPLAPGEVTVEESVPLRLRAVVYDLDQDPILREEWIAEALAEVFAIVADRNLESLALPLLGTRHGRLPPERALGLIDQALAGRSPRPCRRLWLVVDTGRPVDS
jgi:hypothetical protein